MHVGLLLEDYWVVPNQRGIRGEVKSSASGNKERKDTKSLGLTVYIQSLRKPNRKCALTKGTREGGLGERKCTNTNRQTKREQNVQRFTHVLRI